jgi:hypothetical protein
LGLVAVEQSLNRRADFATVGLPAQFWMLCTAGASVMKAMIRISAPHLRYANVGKGIYKLGDYAVKSAADPSAEAHEIDFRR